MKLTESAGMTGALLDILLAASEDELREALAEAGEDFESLAARGRAAAQRAIAETDDEADIRDSHPGLGAFIRLLRRRDRMSINDLAKQARVDATELRCIESDPTFDPHPRTIYQLAQFFKLPSRSLMVLSGSVRVESDLQEEVMRFAASSESISELTREEQKLLNRFVKFLREHTDR